MEGMNMGYISGFRRIFPINFLPGIFTAITSLIICMALFANPARSAQNKPDTKTDGRWTVNVSSYLNKDDALKMVERFKQAGLSAYVVEIDVKGKHYFRVRAGEYATKQEALKQAGEFSRKFNIKGTWVAKTAANQDQTRPIIKPETSLAKPEPLWSEGAKAAPDAAKAERPQSNEPPLPAAPTPMVKTDHVVVKKGAPILHVNIHRDFKYVNSGSPMGMAHGGTSASKLSAKPYEVLTAEPSYAAKPRYGYLKLGNGVDQQVSFAFVENDSGLLYLDKNNNEDLTDDGAPLKNLGSGAFAATAYLQIDVIASAGAKTKQPLNLWFYVNKDGAFFYSICHWAGELELNGRAYKAVAFEGDNHDGLYKESGLCIDLNHNGRCEKESELIKDGGAVTVDGKRYILELDYP